MRLVRLVLLRMYYTLALCWFRVTRRFWSLVLRALGRSV